jgi:glutamine amidotransferase
MGWNQLCSTRDSALFSVIPNGSYAYFVHSYYCIPEDEQDTLITVDYGLPFCAGVQRGNIFGVQFHPEKSQQTGLRLLTNFLEM